MSKLSIAGTRGILNKLTIFYRLLLQELGHRRNWAVRLLALAVVLLVLFILVTEVFGYGPVSGRYAIWFWIAFGLLLAAALVATWYRFVTFWLFAVGLVGATTIVVLSSRWSDSISAVQSRLVSTIFTLFVIVFLGGGVAVLRQWSDRQREAREREKREQREKRSQDRELLLNTHNQLLSAYNRAKRIRRILRARVLLPGDASAPSEAVILASEYDEQMETLIDAQLELETIERRMLGHMDLFRRVSGLDESLAEIRRYLFETVEEYEDRRTTFEGDPPSLPLVKLPELSGFLGSREQDHEYRMEFRTPFQDALMSLRLAVRAIASDESGTQPVEPPSRLSTLGLGMKGNAVRLKPYNPRWSQRFQEESDRLTNAIGDLVHAIEHVGSTAASKVRVALPVIDMLIDVTSLDERDREQLSSALARCGYEELPHPAGVEQLCFRRSLRNVWTHSVSVAEKGSHYSLASIRLRDLLRSDDEVAKHFSDEKERLAKEHPKDPAAYRQAKAELIGALSEKLVAAAGESDPGGT